MVYNHFTRWSQGVKFIRTKLQLCFRINRPPGTPQPFPERANANQFGLIRTLRENFARFAKYWEHPFPLVAYMVNRLRTKACGLSPCEHLTRKDPRVHLIRLFCGQEFESARN